MNSNQQAAPSPVHTVTEYGIRYTQISRAPGDPRLKRRIKYKLCSPATAAEKLVEVRAWQENEPLCPVVDAVVVTRTVTYGAWTVPADARGGA
ncbi:hypothetical protein [Nonomuraea sp. 10N515B]|uniref:hypothetical protein n=1 Tax=Nonomuraea sp. 10N515B TaxID=3457422 RepID=UPI003FCD2CF7